MKRNSKSVMSVIAAAVVALLAAGCVTVPGASEDHGETFSMPVDRGTGS
jgi:predicted small secreted protein